MDVTFIYCEDLKASVFSKDLLLFRSNQSCIAVTIVLTLAWITLSVDYVTFALVSIYKSDFMIYFPYLESSYVKSHTMSNGITNGMI